MGGEERGSLGLRVEEAGKATIAWAAPDGGLDAKANGQGREEDNYVVQC